MPDFIVEINSKSIYGPFTYSSASALRQALVGGNLKMDELVIEADIPARIAVKEVKPEKQLWPGTPSQDLEPRTRNL